jgi:hypothetical protein
VRHSVAIKLLTVFLAAFLLFAATIQERHVHPGATATTDCAVCLAAHSPATLATVSALPLTIAVSFASKPVAVLAVSIAVVRAQFIRPPPAVL